MARSCHVIAYSVARPRHYCRGSETWLYPRVLPRGPVQRLDHRHVPDRIFERCRYLTSFSHGLRKEVALDRVLIASGDFYSPDAASEQVGYAIHPQPARPVRRRVEGDFHFDAAPRAEDVRALVGDHLHAAGEYRLAGREVERGGAQPVDAHVRIAFDQTHYAHRLLAKHKTGELDRVAADVHQRAAAPLRHVANVFGVAVEKAEGGHDGAHVADFPGAHDLARAQPLGMSPNHEGFSDLHAGPVTGVDERAAFGDRQRERLFAEHMLAGFSRANRPGHMHVIRQRIVNGFDLRVGEQLLIRSVRFGDPA